MSKLAGNDLEIERKFTLKRFPMFINTLLENRSRSVKTLYIDQGWLPGKKIHERVRKTTQFKGAPAEKSVYTRTVKLGEGLIRHEYEETINRKFWVSLWSLTDRRLSKVRYVYTDPQGVKWEFDTFNSSSKRSNLMLLEVELPSTSTILNPPDWIKEVIDQEVTTERRYTNLFLARPYHG